MLVASCEASVETTEVNACFEKNVLPLLERDCALCHYHGEYGIKLRGDPADYQELMRYSLPYDSAGSPLMQWASGAFMHPVLWPEGGSEYLTVSSWIDGGMKRDCFDMTFFGDCRFNSDCLSVTCFCPDSSSSTGQVCYRDPATHKGVCARSDNCTESKFGFCKFDKSDGGLEDGDWDMADGDGESRHDELNDGGVEDGYDATSDTGPDADDGVPMVSFSSEIVPMIGSDCRRCHYAGQYGVKLMGSASDYPEIMRYVDVNDAEGYHSFLWWASGGARHPVSWPKGGHQYNLFLKWVQQGAIKN